VSFIKGPDRAYVSLLPPSIEDYIVPAAPVRVVDAFVESLDLSELGSERTVAAAPVAPACGQATCHGSSSVASSQNLSLTLASRNSVLKVEFLLFVDHDITPLTSIVARMPHIPSFKYGFIPFLAYHGLYLPDLDVSIPARKATVIPPLR
jgi:hypothetical protein